MAWQDDYQRSVVPSGVLSIVPPTAVSAGGSIGITPSHKAHWYTVRNVGEVELRLALSAAALAAGVYYPIGKNDSQTISEARAIRRLVIGAPSGGDDGAVSVLCSLSRQPVNANMPELTTANDFPEFDDGDTDNIVPGVG